MDAWIDGIVAILTELMTQNLWFAPVLSLVAGIVTSFTPCSLSAVPMALAYMEGSAPKSSHKALRLSLIMALGMSAAFGIFGCLASAIGHVMHEVGEWWSFLMGGLMILMALQMWEVIHLFPKRHSYIREEEGNELSHEQEDCEVCNRKPVAFKGYVGAFFTGALSGVFASHCAAPVMVALLALVAQSEHGPFWGLFLMVLYAFGHSILLVFASTSYSVVEGWMRNPKYARISRHLRGVVGGLILLIGIFMLII